MMSRKQPAQQSRAMNQQGMVSILVTLIMMMVITLIVIGFTQVTIRSRNDALDRQLSTQALYAAETGVNDVIRKINSGTTPVNKTTCDPNSGPYVSAAGSILNASSDIRYTCVLVTANATTIRTSAQLQDSSVLYINPVNAAGNPVALVDLVFTWSPNLGGTLSDCAGTPSTFPKDWKDCPYGLLRLDLTRVTGSTVSADGLKNATRTVYLSPNGSSTVNLGASQAYASGATCNAVRCTATVRVNDGAHNEYYLRLSSLYTNIPQLTVSSTGGAVHFKGHNVIDVTGRAQDVLRRIQVQVSQDRAGDSTTPNSAIHTTANFCKRFIVDDGYYEDKCE